MPFNYCLFGQRINISLSLSFIALRSDPKKRYQLYLKATQIEMIYEKLNACNAHVRDAKVRLISLHNQTAEHRRAAGELGERVAQLQSVHSLRELVRQLRCQQSWRHVAVQETLAAEIGSALADFQRQYDELQLACSDRAAIEERIRAEMLESRERCAEMAAGIAGERAALERHRRVLQEKAVVQEQLQRTLRKLEAKRQRQQTDCAQLERDLGEKVAADRAESAMSRVQRERARNEAKLAELRVQLEETTAMVESARRDADVSF